MSNNAQPAADIIDVDDLGIKITSENLQECLRSATYWTKRLPQFAKTEQNKADAFAITAGIFAVITGAAVYPAATATTPGWAGVLIAVPALVAAILAVIPNVRNYAETAARARELATMYGPLMGVLTDAVHGQQDQADLHRLMKKFHQVKGKKDQLHRIPTRPQEVPASAHRRIEPPAGMLSLQPRE